ncbi:MAG: HAD-IA family hydrolase [Xenococcaceae cyanobacterium MO_188.B29]|nr:HAD-IA family hydrolase [Xenococcaceae cyanobacterium MO_188.B29]
MNDKIIVFDFDGTIADTYHALFELANELADEFGYKPIAQSDLLRLKNLSSWEIIKQAEIPLFKIPFLFKRIQSELSKEISQIELFAGMETVLCQLKYRGYRLGIITSNTEKNVKAVLANNKLDSLFEFIYAETTIFGKHRVINEMLRKKKINRKNIVYVGDETRDIRSAQKSKISVVAVAWGFNSKQVLAKQQPEFLVEQPVQLLEAIAQWNNSWQTKVQRN